MSCHAIYCNIFMNENIIGEGGVLRGFRHRSTGGLEEAATYPTRDPVTCLILQRSNGNWILLRGWNVAYICPRYSNNRRSQPYVRTSLNFLSNVMRKDLEICKCDQIYCDTKRKLVKLPWDLGFWVAQFQFLSSHIVPMAWDVAFHCI
jgi:hypothetical protein